jgi:hypothetical protein
MISYFKYLPYVHTSSHTKHKNKMPAIDIIPQKKKKSDNQIPKLIAQKITLQDDDHIPSPKTIKKWGLIKYFKKWLI